MSTDLKAIMRRDERRRQMLNDPDLIGDLLLFALALDEVIEIHGRRKIRRSDWIDDLEKLARGEELNAVLHGHWVKRVLEQDAPRYEPAGKAYRGPCSAPMVRREGLCGGNGTTRVLDRDPRTGEGAWVYLCSRHKELAAKFETRAREWKANGRPSPAPNAGGVLRRYFGIEDGLYRWAAPYSEPMEGGREETPPRPRLRLIQGGDVEEVES